MFNYLMRIMQDVIVEPVKPTETEAAVIEETVQGSLEGLIPVLLLMVIALCIVFIINNKRKGKETEAENNKEQKGSL